MKGYSLQKAYNRTRENVFKLRVVRFRLDIRKKNLYFLGDEELYMPYNKDKICLILSVPSTYFKINKKPAQKIERNFSESSKLG